MKRKKFRQLTYDDIMGRYGQPLHHHKRNFKQISPQYSVSRSFDDGEVIEKKTTPSDFVEYVVQSSISDVDFEEYVVSNTKSADVSPLSFSEVIQEEAYTPAEAYVPSTTYEVGQEFSIDVDDPLNAAPAPLIPTPTFTDETPVTTLNHTQQEPAEPSRAQASDDDFNADMEAILKGDKIYDPFTKKLVDKGQGASRPTTPSYNNSNSDNILNPKNSEHAIFDKIAQSMQYANAYDLGTVDLESRFADFDKITDLEKRVASEAKSTAKSYSKQQEKPKVSSTEFMEDLDAIRKASLPKPDGTATNETITDVNPEEVTEKKV